ncbi:hypothetical protein RHAB21_03433 [Pseudorhizobium halotolerans]|uniref:Uncharacterized protein n=1 Tax=Pseudorhizobium halotolerans TaxID=1233081 RepID=A0ABM8PRE3_9HYPH|nr:hypothetical protein RHAB21_03433 [Pseudorhizobium halotolerans]
MMIGPTEFYLPSDAAIEKALKEWLITYRWIGYASHSERVWVRWAGPETRFVPMPPFTWWRRLIAWI